MLRGTTRVLLAVVLLLALLAASWWLDPLRFEPAPRLLVLNALPAWTLWLALLAASRRLVWSASISAGVVGVFHAINARKLLELEIPLLPSDFFLLGQIWESLELYLHYVDPRAAWGLLALPLAWGLWRVETPQVRGMLQPFALGLVAVALAAGLISGASPWRQLHAAWAPEAAPWTIAESARAQGSLAYFLHTMWSESPRIPRPDPARVARAHALREAAAPGPTTANAPEELPDIIVWQSEAFFDPSRLVGIEPEEHLPQLRALVGSHAHGDLAVPTFGGLTSRTEFEVLTGVELAAFTGVQYPYPRLVRAPIPALPHALRAHGYETIAVHPYDARFYRRHRVFPKLGFQRFDAGGEFASDPTHGFFVADSALLERVVSLVEDPARQFVFAISMENHGPWGADRPLDPRALERIEVPSHLAPAAADELRRYLHHAHRADAALGDLARFVLARSEPTLLLFYGDHLPGLHDVYEQVGFDDGGAPTAQPVPWLLLDNRGRRHGSGPRSSALLAPMLLEAAGIPIDGHTQTLLHLVSGAPGLDPDEARALRLDLARARVHERIDVVASSPPTLASFAEIATWGPRSIEADPAAARPLPAIWLSATTPLPTGLRLRLDGRDLDTLRDGSATLIGTPRRRAGRPGWFEKAGRMRLEIHDVARNLVHLVGELEVRPEAVRARLAPGRAARSLCVVDAWGPQTTSRREPTYPSGADTQGLWVESGCFPRQLFLVVERHRLPAVVVDGRHATFRVPNHILGGASRVALALDDAETGERHVFGTMRVSP